MNTQQLIYNPPEAQMSQTQLQVYDSPFYGQQQMYPPPQQMYAPPEQPVYQVPMAQPESDGKKSMSSSEERKEAAQFKRANILMVLGIFIPFLQCINWMCIFSKPRSDRVAAKRTFMVIMSLFFGFFQFIVFIAMLYIILIFTVMIPSTSDY